MLERETSEPREGEDQDRGGSLVAAQALLLAGAFFGSARAFAQETTPQLEQAQVEVSVEPHSEVQDLNIVQPPVHESKFPQQPADTNQTNPDTLTGAQRFDIAVEEAKRLLEDWKTKALAVAGVGLFVAGAIGAIRGAGKMIFAATGFVNQLKDFRTARCIASPSFNLHTFDQRADGSIDIVINTLAAPSLEDLFKNKVTQAIFSSAVDLCTEEQPLPTLAVGDANFLPRLSMMYLPFYPKSWVPCGKADPVSSIPLRREINSLLTQAYSSKYDDGIKAFEAKLPVKIDDHYVIPICDLKNKERELVFVVLSQSNFERFSSEEETADLIRSNPESRVRLEQLRKAYIAHERVLAVAKPANGEKPDLMFPLIRTYVRSYTAPAEEQLRRLA